MSVLSVGPVVGSSFASEMGSIGVTSSGEVGVATGGVLGFGFAFGLDSPSFFRGLIMGGDFARGFRPIGSTATSPWTEGSDLPSPFATSA